MNSLSPRVRGATVGSLLVAGLFVMLGGVTLFDTLSYSDVDSKVFPRAAAVLLITASVISILQTLLKPVADEGFGSGSWWRRALLVVAMLTACVLMPRTGFVVSSAVAFIGALIAAMHDTWRWRLAATYSLAGAFVVGGFFSLFKYGLNVPLP